MSPSPLPSDPASPEVIEIERALTRITYLSTRARAHERLMSLAGVPLDRAAVALLRQIADSEPLRPGSWPTASVSRPRTSPARSSSSRRPTTSPAYLIRTTAEPSASS